MAVSEANNADSKAYTIYILLSLKINIKPSIYLFITSSNSLRYCKFKKSARQEMRILLLIGTGSFIGGIFRYLLSQFIQNRFLSTFPFGTFGVNIIGCFVIGLVLALSERTSMTSELRLFLATGICGGFTTFSAFSNEAFGLLRNGQLYYAILYVTASVVLGVFATFIGYFLFKLA